MCLPATLAACKAGCGRAVAPSPRREARDWSPAQVAATFFSVFSEATSTTFGIGENQSFAV